MGCGVVGCQRARSNQKQNIKQPRSAPNGVIPPRYCDPWTPAIEMMFNTHDPSLWIHNDLILLVLLLPLYSTSPSTTLFVTLVARGRGRDGRITASGMVIGVRVGMGMVEIPMFQLVIFVVVIPARI